MFAVAFAPASVAVSGLVVGRYVKVEAVAANLLLPSLTPFKPEPPTFPTNPPVPTTTVELAAPGSDDDWLSCVQVPSDAKLTTNVPILKLLNWTNISQE